MKKNDRNPRSFPVDQSLPRWACQNCHQNISVSGYDSFSDAARSGMQGSMMNVSGSVMDASRMDQSFVVLSKERNQVTGGAPPRPRTGSMHHQPYSNHSHTIMEESYIMLPPPAASVYKTDFGSDGNVMHSSPSGSGFSSKLKVLKRAFDAATSQTQVDQPLCLECVGVLSDNIDKEVEDVKRDIDAYESCLKELEGEENVVLSESDFLKEKLKVEEEERKLMKEIEETEKQQAQVNATLKELEVKSGRFKELEERYWHEFNNFQCRLTSHQSERDAVLAKIEVSQAHVELLNKTNLLVDAFPITHDTEFGMINNFRLGRLPKIPVEWDEINAAWGQACLLLHTMCQHFRPKFQYRVKILPMGSYPRIMDSSNNVYELFGPVNLFWSTRYDKAMTLFLACLKDFADFAIMMDRESNLSGNSWFYLPYVIDNDKVHGYSIAQSFNKQEHWTKALKYTLCNLKWCLQWFVCNSKTFRSMSSAVTSRPDFPPLHMKHGGNSKSKNSTKAGQVTFS